MFVGRRLPLRIVLLSSSWQFAIAMTWASIVLAIHVFLGWDFMRLPFLPISTIGTAVAFYVGFKNHSAYDRFWEARKIWGGIVNASRSWANATLTYVYASDDPAVAQTLVYRHLAWTNALRLQLRKTSRYAAWRDKRRNRYQWIEAHDNAMRSNWDEELAPFLSPEELAQVSARANPASALLRNQGQALRELFDREQLDLFRQIELDRILQELYALQGKCERIKATPFPRQYAYYARLFVHVFIFMMPFGLLDVFDDKVGAEAINSGQILPAIIMIATTGIVAWVFMTMEFVGDYSEDPFERSLSDVPMSAMCRTIEIDLRQMLGETEVPEPDKPIGEVLY